MSAHVQTRPAHPQDPLGDRGRNVLDWASKNAVYVALVALFIFNLLATRGFASAFTLQNLLFSAAPLILIAVGQTLAIGTGGIDLSVGSVMAFSSATIALYLGYGEAATLLIAVAAAAAIGLVNGSLITFARINPLITGLGLLVAVRGLAQAVSGGSRSPIPPGGLFTWIGNASFVGVPIVALFAFATTAAFIILVRRTTFGRYALFAGSNRSAAFLAGTPRNSTLIGVYIASATLAGIAGVMVSARIGASDPSFIGINFELTAIAAVVIGGTPLAGGRMSILGAASAAIFLQLIDTTFVMQGINPAFSQVLKAVLIIVALYMQRSRKDAR
ncbi:ABC transporter permease [Paenarthrobacter sp. OM7]|uniref:ABC transporter permease n=1 Tax=Paenarthrobacter sp. OM7 TaxID=3041264 RepID=UPI002469A4F7|nr:ABC transporter permease [Paenarthrobacter sp. OM7]WGM20502.1 ABC transporter permease [Paenarthrobacter sp. OM7]